MCYITIRSDWFKAELRRSRSSYTGFCPHPNPFSAELHAPIPGRGREKMLGILYCPMFLNTTVGSKTKSK